MPVAGDRWIAIPDPEAAQVHVEHGSIVFLATGRQTLDRFAALSHATLYCRQIDEPEKPFPFPKGRFVVGRPPFSQNEEERLFTELGIEWLVVKNAGGSASRSKLDAARTLGLPVLMIERPPAVSSMPLDTVEMAIDWVKGQ